jgi:hypothetical protein
MAKCRVPAVSSCCQPAAAWHREDVTRGNSHNRLQEIAGKPAAPALTAGSRGRHLAVPVWGGWEGRVLTDVTGFGASKMEP